MLQLRSFSTENVRLSERIPFWNRITCDAVAPQIVRPADQKPFCGRMTRLDLDNLRMVEVCAGNSVVTNGKVRASDDTVYLARIALSGQVTLIQHDREARLEPGDFTLCDAGAPYQLSFCGSSGVLILRVTREEMLRYVSQPETLLAIPMRGNRGLSGLVSRHVRELWRGSGAFLANGATSRLSEMCMHLLASAYSVVPQARVERSCLVAAHRASVVEYIECNLSAPELTPTTIARALCITPSYLHRIFSDESCTVSRYVMKRRLHECARTMRDPMQRGRTVTAIAAEFGFSSLAHFSRAFRGRYGVSPKEYRHVAQGTNHTS